MGKIDKEKLLKELSSPKHFGYDLVEVIKNFPEEPEQPIDFDALWKDYKNYCIKHDGKCGSCSLNREDNGGETCFINFLKSKNLTAPQIVKNKEQKTICAVCGETKNTPLRRDDMGGYVCLSCVDEELTKRNRPVKFPRAPKSFEIPVKKTWTLKKEYGEFVVLMGMDIPLCECDNIPEKFKKFYELHEEPDYSKITKGSIVECVTKTIGTIHDKIDRSTESQVWFNRYSNIAMSNIISIRIVEMAKE